MLSFAIYSVILHSVVLSLSILDTRLSIEFDAMSFTNGMITTLVTNRPTATKNQVNLRPRNTPRMIMNISPTDNSTIATVA